jgi:chromosome segregation ATPase
VEAEIRRIEANSELDGYKADNHEIELSLAGKEAEVRDWAMRHTAKRAEHKHQHTIAKGLLRNTSTVEKEEIKRWSELPTLQDLDDKITEITARLNLMAEGNPDAIKAYEKREQEIQAHGLKLQGIVERLETIYADITFIREQWEPQLDALVAKISDGFSNNFEKIGCAGQVCVYKDDEFEKWAIQVMVRFR